MSMLKVKFDGQLFILAGDLESGGPISDREAIENCSMSYAYLNPNGKIMRFLSVIGHRDDLEVIGAIEDVPVKNTSGLKELSMSALSGLMGIPWGEV